MEIRTRFTRLAIIASLAVVAGAFEPLPAATFDASAASCTDDEAACEACCDRAECCCEATNGTVTGSCEYVGSPASCVLPGCFGGEQQCETCPI